MTIAVAPDPLCRQVPMAGKSKDPKQARITIRIPVKDRDKLQIKALEQHASIGALVRALIKKGLRETPGS